MANKSFPFISIVLVTMMIHHVLPAQSFGMENSLEYRVKAAFMLNFAKFISWPEELESKQNTSFKVCVLGKDPFGNTLSGLEKKSVGGKRIQVTRSPTLEEIQSCRMVFVSLSERDRVDRIVASMAGRAVVTVSDIKNFATKGGMIEFVEVNGRLSFVVNLGAVSREGVRIEASLLNLARDVLEDRH